MIVIKGDLTINKSRIEPIQPLSLVTQIQDRTYPASESSDSNPGLIIAFAVLEDYNLGEAVVIEEDITVTSIDINDTILVTGNIYQEGGE